MTSRERFTAVLGSRAPARILLEASTESEWVARRLEALGHAVIVADPGFAPMYAIAGHPNHGPSTWLSIGPWSYPGRARSQALLWSNRRDSSPAAG